MVTVIVDEYEYGISFSGKLFDEFVNVFKTQNGWNLNYASLARIRDKYNLN